MLNTHRITGAAGAIGVGLKGDDFGAGFFAGVDHSRGFSWSNGFFAGFDTGFLMAIMRLPYCYFYW